jgi:hypothetical protein
VTAGSEQPPESARKEQDRTRAVVGVAFGLALVAGLLKS